jgi:hypothetical protein
MSGVRFQVNARLLLVKWIKHEMKPTNLLLKLSTHGELLTFQDLTAGGMKVRAFWDFEPCCLTEVDWSW